MEHLDIHTIIHQLESISSLTKLFLHDYSNNNLLHFSDDIMTINAKIMYFLSILSNDNLYPHLHNHIIYLSDLMENINICINGDGHLDHRVSREIEESLRRMIAFLDDTATELGSSRDVSRLNNYINTSLKFAALVASISVLVAINISMGNPPAQSIMPMTI